MMAGGGTGERSEVGGQRRTGTNRSALCRLIIIVIIIITPATGSRKTEFIQGHMTRLQFFSHSFYHVTK